MMRFSEWLFLENHNRGTAIMVLVCNKGQNAGKALILKRGRTAPWKPGAWNLPGGGIDEGESPLEAAKRECEEEAGIIPSNIKSLGSSGDIYAFVGFTNNDHVVIRANHGIIESEAWEWIGSNEIDKFRYADPIIPSMLHRVLTTH